MAKPRSGQMFFLECLKAQSWDHCYSSRLLMTYRIPSRHLYACLPTIVSCTGLLTPWRTAKRFRKILIRYILGQLHADKCHVMRVSHRVNNIGFDYHLGNDVLTSVDEHPYLGLTFTSKLSWKTHISNITLKANRMLGLIKEELEALPPPSERTSLHLLGHTSS